MPQRTHTNRFKKIKKVGEGTYGRVTKYFDHQQKVFIAVKKFKFQDDEQTIPINALREISCLKQLHHPHIIKMHSVFYDPPKKKLTLTFQYIEETLQDYMKRIGTLSPFSLQVFAGLFQMLLLQILTALKYLETQCYIHRDIKPQNIMLTKDNKIKLIDFGQAKKISLQGLVKQKQTLEISTLWYKAPELLLGNFYYTNKIEVWAVGCIFAELATGKTLFDGMSEIQQIFQIFRLLGTPKFEKNKEMREWQYISLSFPKFEAREFYIPIIGHEGNDLLKKMLTINPSSRISISECLHHKYFRGVY